ncbi:Saccharopine dehydrogenase-domain-containing protein [Amylocystis lapponica]|nr:Saccharopine dehydrogenase-domain-containing protein [Amylocystis lapponica]
MPILRRSPFTLRHFPRAPSSRRYHATPSRNAATLTIGIRREDPQRIWERRCPLSPAAVNELVRRDGVQVLVQDCDRRVWSTDEFVRAGAKVHPTLSPAHITLGIKETPLHEVLTDPLPAPSESSNAPSVPRTHFMFSHTTKGQPYNMELLSKFVSESSLTGGMDTAQPALLPRLIDYELLVGEDGKRTVGFGWFAGVAGTLESLSALAHAHLELGIASPFLYTPRPHTHPSLQSLRTVLRDVVGAQIAAEGTPKALGPIVIGVTGTGKVAEGVFDLLRDLPIQMVKVQDLPALVNNHDADLHKVYVVHALPADYFFRHDGMPYNRSDYYANPQDYHSEFHSTIAPYLSLLLNGTGWSPAFPRLMTSAQVVLALERAQHVGRGRFACIGDISCDVEGGVEVLPHSSTLSEPAFTVRPAPHLPPLTMMAVDILPTALPREASEHFSDVLLPYLRTYIAGLRGGQSRGDAGEQGILDGLHRATVAADGELAEPFRWLAGPLKVWSESRGETARSSSSRPPPAKKVLMLGSGMVAGPAVGEICRRGDVQLLVASNSKQEAERLTAPHANASSVVVDVGDVDAVGRLVAEADLVISLLPVSFHPAVAGLCIQYRKHLVTASYISPAMKALHERAVSADVLLLNEIGLDPGIDHCSALSLIESLRAQKKEIVSFTSFCGGLPAPEYAEVPLRYKFSWSPRGVLTAASNDARFKLRGREFEIDGGDLLHEYVPDVPISSVLKFEGIANRDSLPYAKIYGLEPLDTLRTVFRGTLRYPGFCDLMGMFKRIGLLESVVPIQLDSWTSLVCRSLEQRLGMLVMDDPASMLSALSDVVPAKSLDGLLHALHWLSIIPPTAMEIVADSTAHPPLPRRPMAPLDLFAILLAHKLRYEPSERDLVVLSHEIVARPSGAQDLEEVYTSSLVAYGTSEASAMSRCVGLPVAFAALQVLDGGVRARGVQGPTEKEVYMNVLERLEEAGLGMKESVRVGTETAVEGVEERLARQWLSGR